jgi:enoyl-CoA hydratase/carnithine racemase
MAGDARHTDVLLDSPERHVALLTLHRPDHLNAYTPALGRSLADALEELDDDDDVRAIVVTGSGRAFCAGQDLSSGDGGSFAEAIARTDADRAARPQRRPWHMRTPIVAAINGPAVGIGLTMTLQWDVRFVAEDAVLSLPFVRRGIVPDGLSSWLHPRLVGASRAAELVLSGRRFSGSEAAAIGLMARALPAAEVLPHALAYASDLAASGSPTAHAASKALLWQSLGASSIEDFEPVERSMLRWIATQPDVDEGVKAFLEKRPPRWQPAGRPEAFAAVFAGGGR